MAKVTGFTAERMLEIENETVVDGEVQGDNLILTTREGTPINAGNVRGPQGPQGVPGPVQLINDQSGQVYAPRIFSSKSVMESQWASAPEGAFAITTDTDIAWYKSPGGWNASGDARVFANAAERDARWPSPPNGALAILLDDNRLLQRANGAWARPLGMPWGQTYYTEYDQVTWDIGSGPTAVYGYSVHVVAPVPNRIMMIETIVSLWKRDMVNGEVVVEFRRSSDGLACGQCTQNCIGGLTAQLYFRGFIRPAPVGSQQWDMWAWVATGGTVSLFAAPSRKAITTVTDIGQYIP